MKKIFAITLVLAFAVTAAFAGPVSAQKKHAPKGVWRGMLDNVSSLQTIVSTLAVFDMKRIAAVADRSAKRQEFVSNLKKYKGTKVGKLYSNLGAAFQGVAEAARAGEEDLVADRLSGVLKACNACHYNLRDASRRKKMRK